MAKLMTVRISVRRGGKVSFMISTPKAELGGGGTRGGKYAPKDPIRTAFRSAERMLREYQGL